MTVSVDANKPTTTLQLRFFNGSTVRQQFNHSHTIAHLHAFVLECSGVVEYQLLYGFPPRPIPDDTSLTLKDANLLNETVTQKLR